ncbi:MAG TPA: ATP-binding protein [Cellulomonas sp.]
MGEYRRRVVDHLLDEIQPELPALAIQGAKGVGKTTTARERARTVLSFDRAPDRELVGADPAVIERVAGPVLLDEWQRMPEVRDLVRRDVDERAQPGRYLLAGSAAPVGAAIHSGAGRIVSFRMRPLSLAERGTTPPTVSLRDLLTGRARPEGSTTLGLTDYVDEIVSSGFPGIRAASPRVRAPRLDAYLDAVVEREFPEQGLVVRRPEVLRGWLRAFAAATSSTASYNAILHAATPGQSDKPARTTTTAYRDVLAGLWLVDSLDAWIPGTNDLTRLGQAPKHQLADPALAARLLGVDADSLLSGTEGPAPELRRGTLLGALFEHLVALSVQVYAQAADATVHHLRTRNGDHEIDLVVRRPDGRVLAVEVKLANSVSDSDVRHLHWLRDKIGPDLVDALVVTTGRDAYRRKDGVAVVPAALLGP